jgi:hypothetical protein
MSAQKVLRENIRDLLPKGSCDFGIEKTRHQYAISLHFAKPGCASEERSEPKTQRRLPDSVILGENAAQSDAFVSRLSADGAQVSDICDADDCNGDGTPDFVTLDPTREPRLVTSRLLRLPGNGQGEFNTALQYPVAGLLRALQ